MVPPDALEFPFWEHSNCFHWHGYPKNPKVSHQCFVSDTHTHAHAHTQSQGSQPCIYVPSDPALSRGAGVNPGTEKTILNMPAWCSHGNSILPADTP